MDRGMIKWEPFNSVVSASKIIKDVLNEKEKIKKPILSEEQIQNIAQRLLESYHEKENAEIFYYEDGYIKKIIEQIKKIDPVSKKVYLSSKNIYFSQIIKIN